MKIGIIGSGAWALGIAQIISEKYPILIWSRDEKQSDQINNYHKNDKYLPEIKLSEYISCTTKISDLMECKIIIVSLPINSIREVLLQLVDYKYEDKIFLSPSKGIEITSQKFATEIYQEILPKISNFACISGANFAIDLAQLLPSSTSIAANNNETLLQIKDLFRGTKLQTIKSNNIITIQCMGAYKNIAAIGCGLVHKIGNNAWSTAFNNFFLEMQNFINLMLLERGKKEDYLKDIHSPAGIGDFFGTCISTTSRNFKFGSELGRDSKSENNLLCEGKYTIKALEKHLDKLPLVKSLYEIIYENKDKNEIIKTILTLK